MAENTAIDKWRKLSRGERMAWLRAAFCLLCIGTSLRVLSFGQFRSLYGWAARGKYSIFLSEEDVQRVTWAVRSAAYHLPMSVLCLPQALAAKYLLRNAATIELHIGVALTADESFVAHAWVEWQGKIVIGESTDGRVYKPIWHWQ
jgi:hypothetical protein